MNNTETFEITVPEAYRDIFGNFIVLNPALHKNLAYDQIFSKLRDAIEMHMSVRSKYEPNVKSSIRIQNHEPEIIYAPTAQNDHSAANASVEFILFALHAHSLSKEYLTFSRTYTSKEISNCSFVENEPEDLFSFIRETADVITIQDED